MTGLKRGTVALSPHDPEWAWQAQETIGVLRERNTAVLPGKDKLEDIGQKISSISAARPLTAYRQSPL